MFERLDDLEKRVGEDQSIIDAMEVLERRGYFYFEGPKANNLN